MKARYVHTNLIARNYLKLTEFYMKLFGFTFVPPERDYSGKEMDCGTGLKDVHVKGVHLRMPGYTDNGPTLEIYTYNNMEYNSLPKVNEPGFGHLAFEVDDVKKARLEVLENGGEAVGDIVTVKTKVGSEVTWCYTRDPEGNIIELQSWK